MDGEPDVISHNLLPLPPSHPSGPQLIPSQLTSLELVSGKRYSMSLTGARFFIPHNHMSLRPALWPISPMRNTQLSALPTSKSQKVGIPAWVPS